MTKKKVSSLPLIFAVFICFCAPFLAQAIESGKPKFSKAVYINISTVTDYRPEMYLSLINKPLVKLTKVYSDSASVVKTEKSHSNFFEMAMQMQDRFQYYLVKVEDTFTPNNEVDVVDGECSSGMIAKLAKMFSF